MHLLWLTRNYGFSNFTTSPCFPVAELKGFQSILRMYTTICIKWHDNTFNILQETAHGTVKSARKKTTISPIPNIWPIRFWLPSAFPDFRLILYSIPKGVGRMSNLWSYQTTESGSLNSIVFVTFFWYRNRLKKMNYNTFSVHLFVRYSY